MRANTPPVEQGDPFAICPVPIDFVNMAPRGYNCPKVVGSDPSEFEFTINPVTPLRLRCEGGWMMVDQHFFTDKASVPFWCHWFEDRDTHECSAFFHDNVVKFGGLFWCSVEDGPYLYRQMSRALGDELYRRMLLVEPPFVSSAHARIMWMGVRAGAWARIVRAWWNRKKGS